MNRRTHLFLGGFAIALILIGMLCGMILVDLSTDRYMPGRTGSAFAVTSVRSGGMELSFMGEEYVIPAPFAEMDSRTILKIRSALPLPWQVASDLGSRIYANFAVH